MAVLSDTLINGKLRTTGGIFTDTTSLPQVTSPSYVVCIDAFASGGQMKWTSTANLANSLASTLAASTAFTNKYVQKTQLGSSSGSIPVLNSSGLLDANLLPSIALTDTFSVSTQTEMLALSAEQGDVCVRTDLHQTYILKSGSASVLANWVPLETPTGGVTSVIASTGLTGGTITSTGTIAVDFGTGQDQVARGNHTHSQYSTTDTKNTAGATNATSTVYLIGATSRDTNPQTYSVPVQVSSTGAISNVSQISFSGNTVILSASELYFDNQGSTTEYGFHGVRYYSGEDLDSTLTISFPVNEGETNSETLPLWFSVNGTLHSSDSTGTVILGNYISYSSISNYNSAGTTKTVAKTNPQTLYVPNGLIMGGTAAAAGLVTRGICGVATPDDTGATKENLYINYDGDNTYRSNRQVVLQAGAVGTHYGNNVYQYTAVRGDAMKAWVEAKGYVTSSGVISIATSGVGLSGGTITSTGTITLDSSSSGNASANKVIIRDVAGNVNSETYTITKTGTKKAHLEYNSTDDAIKFIFD